LIIEFLPIQLRSAVVFFILPLHALSQSVKVFKQLLRDILTGVICSLPAVYHLEGWSRPTAAGPTSRFGIAFF
jgi:hypothetical protein